MRNLKQFIYIISWFRWQYLSKLRQNDAINDEEKEDSKNSIIYNNIKQRVADIFLRNNSINNKYKCFSQSSQSQFPKSSKWYYKSRKC